MIGVGGCRQVLAMSLVEGGGRRTMDGCRFVSHRDESV